MDDPSVVVKREDTSDSPYGYAIPVPDAPDSLQDLCKQAAAFKSDLDLIEFELKGKRDAYNKITETVLKALELAEMDSVKAHGFLFFKQTKTSVQTPKTVEDKQKLFEFLESHGLFHEIVSVNSQTLNSLYKSLADDAATEGNLSFKLPGVGDPVSYTTLKLRRQ